MTQILTDPEPSITAPAGRRLLSEFFDRMSEKAYALDANWTIIAFNGAAEAYFGLRRQAVLGRNAREVFPTGPGSPFETAIQRVMAGEAVVEFEAPSVVVPDVVARGRVFRLADGGAGLIWSDVTRERDLRARLGAREAALTTSEARLDLAMAAAHLGDFSWDAQADVTEVSPRAADLIGWPAGEPIDRDALRAFFHPDDRARVAAEAKSALREKRSFELEYRIRRPVDGAEIWVLSRGRGVYDAQGRLTGLLGVVGDITARKEVEQRLAESEARLRLAMDAAHMGEWSWDAETDRVELSPRAAQIAGLPSDAPVARENLRGLYHPDDRERVAAQSKAALAEARSFDLEYRLRRPVDGREIWIASRGRGVHDDQGRILGEIGVIVDITAQKRAETELREERERLAQVERIQSFLLRLTDAQRGLSDPAEIMRTASRMLCDHLHARRAGYLEVDETATYVDVDPAWIAHGPPVHTGRRRLDEYGAGTADDLRSGRIVAVRDVEEDPRTNSPEALAAFRAVPIRAFLTAPLIEGGRLTGLLFLHDAEPRAWSPSDQALVVDVAERTWAALARARAEEALRGKEALLRLGFSAARMVAWEHNPETGETIRSENAREVLGEPGPDGKYLSLLAPEDREMFLSACDQTLATGEPGDITYRQPSADGRGQVWLNTRAVRRQEGGHTRLVGVTVDVTERKLAEEWLRQEAEWADAGRIQAERDRERFWDLSRDLFAVVASDGIIRELNGPAWEAVLGWPEAVLRSTPLQDLVHPEDMEATLGLSAALRAGPLYGYENRYRHADGGWRWLSWNAVAEGGLIYAVARDVTEEKAREARALRSQKLESLGRLTGGVAHDFNNLLTAIIGSLDMIQKRPEDAERRERLLAAALTAARRGEGLNKQLLGFARRQAVNTEFVCPDAFIADLKPLLEGAIGDVVRLRLDLRAAELGTCVDPAQFEAALLNLVVNARDAMPAGGDAVVSTALSDAADVERLGLPPGRYLSVQVRDTGVGMTQDVLAQVFEPFFTTKEVGKGTGLGLSQVYGFARQSGGGADVASTPGEGATVTMFLPLAEPAKRGAAEVAAEPASRPRALDVLLVEDDALVGVVTDSMLADLGCRVVRAEAGPEALRKLDEGRFDLLLTDVRMPGGMNGVQLAEEAVRRRPDLKVLLCSGWTADALGDELRGARWPLLAKPFDAARLERAIREVVGAET